MATMSLTQKLDSLLRRGVDVGDVPGVVAMATNCECVTYQGAFGKRALGGDQAMTMDTVVWIASMTKAITGAAVMQLVERGSLDLDRPASTWVPDLASVQVLEGFDSSGTPHTRPPKRPITLRHLLTHTAGYGYPIWSEALARYYRVMNLPSTGSCEMAALRIPLLFDPGERWGYGINLEWAGKTVEVVSGKKLSAYLRENLFDPLDMRDTAFKITPSMRERLAKLHERGDDGALRPIDFEVPQEPETEMGGGGLYSTAGDYLKFVRMILNRGRGGTGRVLKPETVDLMSRNHIGELRVTMLKSAMPTRSNDVELFPGVLKTWGLSFMINEETAPTGRSPGSLSWAGLSNCYYWIDPSRQLGGVYLTQILPFGDRKALPLYLEFESAIYQSAT
jgi:CubicO group peptidase (beta-lactamase class C family)